MNFDFFITSPNIIFNLHSISQFLLYCWCWFFAILFTYDLISFFYDLYERSCAKNKKWLLKSAILNFFSFIWLPIISFFVILFSWYIVYYYMSFLSSVFSFKMDYLSNASDLLVWFLTVSPLYNLIFLILWMLLIMFSFKNKVLCVIWIIISMVWFLFPLIAVSLSLA